MIKTIQYEYNGQEHKITIDEEKRTVTVIGRYNKKITEMIQELYREREKEKLKDLIFGK